MQESVKILKIYTSKGVIVVSGVGGGGGSARFLSDTTLSDNVVGFVSYFFAR